MAILQSNNPNELRKSAVQKIEQAKALQAMIEGGTQIGDKAEVEGRVDEYITEAEAERAAAKAVEQREAEAAAKRKGGGQGRGPLDPLSELVYGSSRNRHGEPAFDANKPQPLTAWLSADPADLDDGGFDNFGEMLRSIRDQRAGSRTDDRLQYLAQTGQTVGSDPYGGFFVPEAFQRDLIVTNMNMQPWLSQLKSYVVPDGTGGSITTPRIADRNRSGEDIAGVELTRVGETGGIGLSTFRCEARTAVLTKAATRVPVSNELLQDSAIGINEVLQDLFGKAITLRQAIDVLGGTGAGQPMGIHTSGATYTVAKESGQEADTIVGANLLNMRQRGANYSRMIWIANEDTLTQLTTAHTTLTNDDYPLFIHGNGTDVPDTLLGRPIYWSEACQTLGDKGDIVLFDPQSYYYIQKPLRVDVSRDYRFNTDEAEFRIVLRDDGSPLYGSTQTSVRGFETSEFVTLAARA